MQDIPKVLAVPSEGVDYFTSFVEYTEYYCRRRALSKGLSEFVPAFEDNSLLIRATVTRCWHKAFTGAV